MSDDTSTDDPRDADRGRIAKVMARAGVASRREAEAWIAAGRVSVNGRVISSPALNVGPDDVIAVDGAPLPRRERTRLWLYHKPRGLVTTAKDPEGRTTVFDVLPPELPRVVSVGRLDLNTEGLLLLTNDGGLARVLAHPSTGWLRRYRVRAFGQVDTGKLQALADGIEIDGFAYGPIEAVLDRQQGDNAWLTLGLREGKNREVRRVLEHLGLKVNRLIRVSFGPFQLGELAEGAAEEIRTRHLRDQLGGLADEAGCDFEAPVIDRTAVARKQVRAGATEGPRRRAGLTRDRKGRRVLVERIEKATPKTAKPRRVRKDGPVHEGGAPAGAGRPAPRAKGSGERSYGNRARVYRGGAGKPASGAGADRPDGKPARRGDRPHKPAGRPSAGPRGKGRGRGGPGRGGPRRDGPGGRGPSRR